MKSICIFVNDYGIPKIFTTYLLDVLRAIVYVKNEDVYHGGCPALYPMQQVGA